MSNTALGRRLGTLEEAATDAAREAWLQHLHGVELDIHVDLADLGVVREPGETVRDRHRRETVGLRLMAEATGAAWDRYLDLRGKWLLGLWHCYLPYLRQAAPLFAKPGFEDILLGVLRDCLFGPDVTWDDLHAEADALERTFDVEAVLQEVQAAIDAYRTRMAS